MRSFLASLPDAIGFAIFMASGYFLLIWAGAEDAVRSMGP